MARTLTLVSVLILLATAFTLADEPAKKAELQFLYRIQPTRAAMLTSGPTPQETEILTAHFNYLKNLTAKGVVILAGAPSTTTSPPSAS